METQRAQRIEGVLPKPSAASVFAAFGRPQPPSHVEQEVFDDRLILEELLRHGHLDAPIMDGALYEYCLCLKYVHPLQPDLMRHALPLCLQAWQAELFNEGHENVARAFNSALSNRPQTVATTIGEAAACVVRDFMRSSIIARMSHELKLYKPEGDTSAHTWISFLASYGCIWPDVGSLFRTWRTEDIDGLAISAVEYVSLLAYDDREHPLFIASAPHPGAVPRPWDYAGEDAEASMWLSENVDALKEMLTVDEIEHWIRDAADHLASHSERRLAELVAEDVLLQPYLINSRIKDLLHNMSSTDPYKHWSDMYGMTR